MTQERSAIPRSTSGAMTVWCGDEVTQGAGIGQTERYSSLVCSALDMAETNLAKNGAGFAVDGNTIDMQLDEAAKTLGDTATTVSWVMLMAGLNDPFDMIAMLQQTVTDTINKANELFPNARIVVGCGPGCIPEDSDDITITTQTHVLTAIRLAGDAAESATISDMRAICGSDPALRADGINPNAEGHALIAKAVETAIREDQGEPVDTPVADLKRRYRAPHSDLLGRVIQDTNRREAEKREANRPTGTETRQLTRKMDELTRAQGLQQVILQQQQEQLRQQQEMLDRQQQQLKQQQDALASQQDQLKQQQEQLSGVVGQQGSTLESLQSLTARLDMIQNQTLQTVGVNLQTLFDRTDQLLERVQALEDRGSVGA